MSIFGKLVTLFRGTAHEAGEKIVDAKALTILDQEIRDAATQLDRSKVDLARLMGQSKLSENEIGARDRKIADDLAAAKAGRRVARLLDRRAGYADARHPRP